MGLLIAAITTTSITTSCFTKLYIFKYQTGTPIQVYRKANREVGRA